MKKSQLFPLAGLVLPTLFALSACSGTPTADGGKSPSGLAPVAKAPAPAKAKASKSTAAKPTKAPATAPQGRGNLQGQANAARLADAIRKARQALAIGNFTEALRESAFALRVDRNNKEAQDLFARAQELLGEKATNEISAQQGSQLRWQIQQERDRARAVRAAQLGDAHSQAGRFDSAVESFERAVTILQFSPFFSRGDQLLQSLTARRDVARKQRVQARQDKVARDRSASEEAQRKEERLRKAAQVTRIRRLFEDANRSFQHGKFAACIKSLEIILSERPFHENALALRDLANRAHHDQTIEQLDRRWKSEWAKTFDNSGMLDVPQSDIYRWDADRRRLVSTREPLEFKSEDASESPEEQAILAKLNSNPQPFNFSSATLDEWAAYFGDRTQVNFVVTKSAAEMDSDTTALTDFSLPPKTAAQALDVIAAKTGVKWRIMYGMVQLIDGSSEAAVGRMHLESYDVRDIVNGIPNRPGREPKLRVPGEEEILPEEDEEPAPTIVDTGKLQDLIRDNIGGDTWDSGGASISELRGTLLVRHTRNVHRQIKKLLSDLRESVGIQVDVESRFIQVTDNFLEDLGVDFRGLGNDSSEGVPGRGLANRSNVGFDDFGRRENINPAAPGLVGTGTEPGIFYDDGGDGDLFGRTENLFDNSIGGQDALDNGGGLALQYAFLDDTEVEMIFRAVTKNDRSQEITAPRLLIYNNTRANMSVARQTTYIKDFEVEIAQAAAVANPVIGVVKDGVSLDVRPVVSADRKFVTMDLRPTVLDLTLPIPTFTTTLGVGQPITMQLPQTVLKKVRTTITMPDGGTVLLGGMKISNKNRLESGIPFLSNIPLVSFLFGRRGTSVTNTNLLILIRASIIIPAEHEPDLTPGYIDGLVGGGK